VETGGQVLAHHHFSEDDIRHVVEYFGDRGVEYFLESNEGLFGSAGVRRQLCRLIYGSVTDEDVLAELERGLGGFIDAIKVDGDPFATRINKVSFLDSDTTLDEIREEFSERFTVIPTTVPMFGPNSGELSLRGIHKAGGIELLTDHLGIDRADTMALGDGFNDLEMLAHVEIGIAMGDAPQAVKDVADDVTGGPDEDGIWAAFAKYGLVDGAQPAVAP
jgi:Cof subfamily protein (haloacid dehalogenase superfamily)